MASNEKVTSDQKKFVAENFQKAFERKDKKTMDLCLQKGADIDAILTNGYTALQRSVVIFKDEEMVDYILSKNPDLFKKEVGGQLDTIFGVVLRLNDGAFKTKMVEKFLNLLPDADRQGNVLAKAFSDVAKKISDEKPKNPNGIPVPKKANLKTLSQQSSNNSKKDQESENTGKRGFRYK